MINKYVCGVCVVCVCVCVCALVYATLRNHFENGQIWSLQFNLQIV